MYFGTNRVYEQWMLWRASALAQLASAFLFYTEYSINIVLDNKL